MFFDETTISNAHLTNGQDGHLRLRYIPWKQEFLGSNSARVRDAKREQNIIPEVFRHCVSFFLEEVSFLRSVFFRLFSAFGWRKVFFESKR